MFSVGNMGQENDYSKMYFYKFGFYPQTQRALTLRNSHKIMKLFLIKEDGNKDEVCIGMLNVR